MFLLCRHTKTFRYYWTNFPEFLDKFLSLIAKQTRKWEFKKPLSACQKHRKEWRLEGQFLTHKIILNAPQKPILKRTPLYNRFNLSWKFRWYLCPTNRVIHYQSFFDNGLEGASRENKCLKCRHYAAKWQVFVLSREKI